MPRRKKYKLVAMRIGYQSDLSGNPENKTIAFSFLETMVANHGECEVVDDTNSDSGPVIWKFGNYGIHNEGTIVYGILGEIKNHQIHTSYDRVRGNYIERETNLEHVEHKSKFIYDKTNQVLIFDTNSGVSRSKFMMIFSTIHKKYNTAGGELTYARMSLSEDEDIIETISKWTTISSIRINVKPTNPRDFDSFREMDQDLQKSNIQTLHLEAKSGKDETLKIPNGSYLYMALRLSEAGYGDYFIRGEVNGSSISKSPANKPAVSIEAEDDKERTFVELSLDLIHSLIDWLNQR